MLGHTLSLITLKTALAARLVEGEPAAAANEIRDIHSISKGALIQVRAAVNGYRTGGFVRELRNVRQILEAAGVTLETDVERLELPPNEDAALALALREAVTNVVRHAEATWCSVRFFEENGARVLAITDNGGGMRDTEGSGLIGMRERIATVGGTLNVVSEHGTTVRIALPVRMNSRAPAGHVRTVLRIA